MAASGSRAFFLPLLVAGLLAFSLPARAARPDTELEKLVGKPAAWGLITASGADTDPLLLGWVRRIGQSVSAQAPRRDIPYTFTILGTDTANALAAPGGYIFVTRGLLDTIESDDELAAILAHEAGHVSKRHALQQIESSLLFLLLLQSAGGRLPDQARTLLVVANVLRTLHKSREMERQADGEGIAYAAAAGYDPGGLVHFFERLSAGRDEPSRLLSYFATHPSPRRRLEEARQNPRVRRDDPASRELLAQSFAARGLAGAARTVRRGGDPLRTPLSPRPAASNNEERRSLARRAEEVRRGLIAPYRTQRVGSGLQQLLLINSQPTDLRWVVLALRAYAVETDVEDIYERALRVARTALPTYDGLTEYAGDDFLVNFSAGRGEVRAALERLGGAPAPLRRASQAALAVLADLNNPLYHPTGTGAWVRYGTLEGLLRYAESELARAARASGTAWRLLSLARIRRYEAQLSALIPPDDPARRGLWADLLARRLGTTAMPMATPEGPAGPATVRVALAVELGESVEAAGAHRPPPTPWADWVLERKGIPENIATMMRLLTLELEREIGASPEAAPSPVGGEGAAGTNNDAPSGAGNGGPE